MFAIVEVCGYRKNIVQMIQQMYGCVKSLSQLPIYIDLYSYIKWLLKTSRLQQPRLNFREHYDKLVDSIQEADLPVLGARFFCRQIISRETMERVGNVFTSRAFRVSKLMLAVMAQLDVHPDKFESALDVFREELVYAEFASLIASSIGKCRMTLYTTYRFWDYTH